jgi:hypothetical protein
MRTILSKLGLRENDSAKPVRAPADVAAWREIILDRGLDADRARSLGDALEAEGRQLEAIEACVAANRLRRDPALERRLVRLRHAAFAQLERSLSPSWPPFIPEDRPGAQSPPIVAPAELTPGVLRNGILRHGCVWVRGLVPPRRVGRLVETIDRAFEAHDACARGGGCSPFFDPLEAIPNGEAMRGWIRDGQGVLAADSPRGLYEFLETVHELRLDELLHGFFGDRPVLSAEKCTLRRVDNTPSYASWHQDGAFMGKGLRTVNIWFALSRCGRDAPGLDLIPRRLAQLLPTGGEGAIFDWSVSDQTIARELPGVSVWRPEFEAGDALLFDDLCLHRTAVDSGMTQLRYAIESWFFSSSAYPVGTQTPILV